MKAQIAVGSRWKAEGGAIFVVTERRPFGRFVVQREDRFQFGEVSQRSILRHWVQVH